MTSPCGAFCCADGRAWKHKDTVNANPANPIVTNLVGVLCLIPGIVFVTRLFSASHNLRCQHVPGKQFPKKKVRLMAEAVKDN